jgi:hypothetical protein
MEIYDSKKKVERSITENTRAVQVLIKICLFQGLGTSTAQEGQEYFEDIAKHKKDFVWAAASMGSCCGDLLDHLPELPLPMTSATSCCWSPLCTAAAGHLLN